MSNHIETNTGREKGKAISWEGVRKGDTLNSVKKFLKQRKSNDDLPKLPESKKPILAQVEDFITKQGIVDAHDGRQVNLANPDSFEGQPPTVRQRALHLITKSTNNPSVRERDIGRYPFVAAIPKTLSDPDLIANGKYNFQDRIYYFRNYRQGTHLVITDKKGKVIEQGEADGLLTQYSPDLGNKTFDNSFKVSHKKNDPISEVAS